MKNYHNDKPITGENENPDLLNRESFAENLANVLYTQSHSDCITVSLESEWGYGKTSVINLIKKSLNKKSNQPIIIEYNPWLAGNADALVQDFLVQFSSQLGIPSDKKRLEAATKLLKYSKLFNAAKFIPGVEPWASILKNTFELVGDAAENKLKDIGLLHQKNNINNILKDLNLSIIVIIDDIDRLTPDEVFQVIRLIKAVADFQGTSFLLAFDPVYLASSLKRHGIENSNQYIDKIVQLRMPLPLIAPKDLQELASSELQKISETFTENFDYEQYRFSDLYHKYAKHLIRSPREVKRIFNHLRFILEQIEGEVCFTDLYYLSVIAIKEQEIYQSLKDSPEYYVGLKFDDPSFFGEKPEDAVKNNENERNTIFQNVSSKDKTYVYGILKNLFPLLDDSMNDTSNYDQHRRVASIKRLHIALHYQVPAGSVSNKDAASFLNGTIDRKEFLERAISQKFVARLFELLYHNIDKVSTENATLSLHAIYATFFDSAYLKECEEKVMDLFEFSPYSMIKELTFKIIKTLKNKELFIFDLLKEPHFLPIATDIAREIILPQEEREYQLNEEKWLSPEKSDKYLKDWATIVEGQLLNGPLIDSIHASHIYFVLYRVSKPLTKKILSQWLSEKSGIEKIAKLIGYSGRDSTNGQFSDISKDALIDLLDFNILKEKALIELEKPDTSIRLIAIYLSITTGKKHYLIDASKG